LAVGVHYVEVPPHNPEQVVCQDHVMPVGAQLAYYLGLLSDPRLALRDVPIGNRQMQALALL
jgi:hypothetical protein